MWQTGKAFVQFSEMKIIWTLDGRLKPAEKKMQKNKHRSKNTKMCSEVHHGVDKEFKACRF